MNRKYKVIMIILVSFNLISCSTNSSISLDDIREGMKDGKLVGLGKIERSKIIIDSSKKDLCTNNGGSWKHSEIQGKIECYNVALEDINSHDSSMNSSSSSSNSINKFADQLHSYNKEQQERNDRTQNYINNMGNTQDSSGGLTPVMKSGNMYHYNGGTAIKSGNMLFYK